MILCMNYSVVNAAYTYNAKSFGVPKWDTQRKVAYSLADSRKLPK